MLPLLEKYRGQMEDACEEKMRLAESCLSTKQLADVAFSAQGIEYIAQKIAIGDLPTEAISDGLAAFVNGRYIRSLDGYTSAIYINCGDVVVDTTCSLLINCKRAIVPHHRLRELVIVGECEIDCPSDSSARIWRHLPNGTIKKERL